MIGIELDGITKLYGSGAAEVAAVAGVDARVEPGELFFLLGPSGCGKTTLLRIVAGLIVPTAGRVLFDGRDVTALPVQKRNTAMVFQNYALWPHMTVQQNVRFGPKMRGLPAAEQRQVATESLQRVEMEAFTRRKPNQLSGGQQQRVAVARALAAQPDCLLLDEPLSNLDARLRLHMRGELRELVKSTGTTTVYVTHDQKEALSMADRVAVMTDGKIVQLGTPAELYNRPGSHFVADFLGEVNFIDGTVAAAGDPVRVDTPAGPLPARAVGKSAAGDQVTCCVRPERIRMAAEGAAGSADGESALSATVESVTFLGEIRQVYCRLADGTGCKVTTLSGAAGPCAPGDRVALRIRPDDVALLAGPAAPKQ